VACVHDGEDREHFDSMFTKYKARLFDRLVGGGAGKSFEARAARYVVCVRARARARVCQAVAVVIVVSLE
jgi:hypothetical protein